MDGKTIADAINEVTDDEVVDETTGDDEQEEAPQGSLLDEEDEVDEEEEESDEEESDEEEAPDTTTRGDVQGTVEEADEPDVFDTLTPEEISAIKADPTLNKLRKSLMRGYSAKTADHSQLVQLGNAYKQDPVGVLHAIAKSLGMQVGPAVAAPAAPAAAPEADPGKELEELFGEQIGPKVRAVFDKWAEARLGQRLSTEVAPLKQSIQSAENERQQARMRNEELSFKSRHKDVTPDVEREIVALGNSGKIVPGGMTPSEYLDTLYDVVMARRSRQGIKKEVAQSSVKLAKRIEQNRQDREPSGVSGRGGSVKKVSKIPQARSISEALDMAMLEMEDER